MNEKKPTSAWEGICSAIRGGECYCDDDIERVTLFLYENNKFNHPIVKFKTEAVKNSSLIYAGDVASIRGNGNASIHYHGEKLQLGSTPVIVPLFGRTAEFPYIKGSATVDYYYITFEDRIELCDSFSHEDPLSKIIEPPSEIVKIGELKISE